MNIICIFNCWDPCQTISIIITLIVAILPYIILFFILRPKLKIESACYDKDRNKLKIKVINNGCFSAVSLRIEACATYYDIVKKKNYTFHFKIDHNEFLILSGKLRKQNINIKTFKISEIAESAKEYLIGSYGKMDDEKLFLKIIEDLQSGKYKLRVRIHSFHEFSGLGKAEEKSFMLSKTSICED